MLDEWMGVENGILQTPRKLVLVFAGTELLMLESGSWWEKVRFASQKVMILGKPMATQPSLERIAVKFRAGLQSVSDFLRMYRPSLRGQQHPTCQYRVTQSPYIICRYVLHKYLMNIVTEDFFIAVAHCQILSVTCLAAVSQTQWRLTASCESIW